MSNGKMSVPVVNKSELLDYSASLKGGSSRLRGRFANESSSLNQRELREEKQS
jgi:hypothetical protein